jgi:hypothetical protein
MIVGIILIVWFNVSLKNVAKDIYVPEIRVYEKIQRLNINK